MKKPVYLLSVVAIGYLGGSYLLNAKPCYELTDGGYVTVDGVELYACPRPDGDSKCLKGIDCPEK